MNIKKLTWPVRRRYYKVRLFYKASKAFYAPWECQEMLLTFNFELLCDFYEHGGLDSVNWNSYKYHKKAKEEIDRLYSYWKIERKQREEEIDYLLDQWSEHTVHYETPCEDHPGLFEWHSVSSNYGEYLSNLYNQEQIKFLEEEEKNLIRLIKIRGYLWT